MMKESSLEYIKEVNKTARDCIDVTNQGTDAARNILQTVGNYSIPFWASLTQIAPANFKGFLGFISNQGALTTNPPGTNPPSGSTFNSMTDFVNSAPFYDPLATPTKNPIPQGTNVDWTIEGTSLHGTAQTNAQGVATITLLAKTIVVGSYTAHFHADIAPLQIVGGANVPPDQNVQFAIQS